MPFLLFQMLVIRDAGTMCVHAVPVTINARSCLLKKKEKEKKKTTNSPPPRCVCISSDDESKMQNHRAIINASYDRSRYRVATSRKTCPPSILTSVELLAEQNPSLLFFKVPFPAGQPPLPPGALYIYVFLIRGHSLCDLVLHDGQPLAHIQQVRQFILWWLVQF